MAEAWAATLPGGPQGLANAMQHSFWNAWAVYLTNDVEWVEFIATAHEYSARIHGGLAYDSVMDLHNNAVGRSVGIAALNLNPAPGSFDEAEQVIKSMLLNEFVQGRMYIIDITPALAPMVRRSDGGAIE
jgi:hypothetical protein